MGQSLSQEVARDSERRKWRRLAVAAAVVVLLVLAVVLPPLIHLGRFRRSITASMSAALGRPVYVGEMQLRLLPTPGVEMTDVTVAEDPAFGYEPALHATTVVASMRLSSLWRGRLEVSRISLNEANVNLVRNAAGQWNIGTVLLRASQIRNAPTGERHAGEYARFPYIEASDTRIDFKDGVEKRPFSLMNAEFAMWQASGGEWRLRLKAAPVRTDLELHLSDTGSLSVEGSLRKAAALQAMPVDLRAEWSGAQLGQVSEMLAGFDSGWRGDLDATATLKGTAGDLHLQSRVRIGNLRRQEFQPATTLDVDATCRGEYWHGQRTLGNLTCFWPVGSGHLLLTGGVQGFRPAAADLQLEMNQIPAAFAVSMLGRVRPHAENISTTGTINGSFHLTTGEHASLSGDATATGVTLGYSGGTLTLPALHFAGQQPEAVMRKPRRKMQEAPVVKAITLQPFSIAMGEPQPLVADGRFTRAGFELHLTGPAAIGQLMTVGANFGLLENSVTALSAKGRANVNTTTAGSWLLPMEGAGTGIGTNGTVQVSGAELRAPFLHAPVEVTSADISIAPDRIAWQNVALEYQGLNVQGSLEFPAVCNQPTPCASMFTLQTGSLNAAAVEGALTGNPNPGLLGQIFSGTLGGTKTVPWPPMQGTIMGNTMQAGKLTLNHPTASVAVEGTTLTIRSLDAGALGGSLHASGQMTMENGVPHWSLGTRLTGANANQVAGLFGEHWGSGMVNGDAKLTMSGYHTAELASSAAGDFRITWQNGGLALAGAAGPLPVAQFARWSASGTVSNSAVKLTESRLVRGGQSTAVRGSIGFDRSVDLTVDTRRGPVKVGGTLAHPAVAR